MELLETDGEDLEWRLHAEKAEVYEEEGIAYLQQIILIYSAEGGEKIVLTGEKGKIYLPKKDVSLEGNVEASSNQIQLKTDTLLWSKEKKLVTTEKIVRIKQNNIEITGRGMVADINLLKIKLR